MLWGVRRSGWHLSQPRTLIAKSSDPSRFAFVPSHTHIHHALTKTHPLLE